MALQIRVVTPHSLRDESPGLVLNLLLCSNLEFHQGTNPSLSDDHVTNHLKAPPPSRPVPPPPPPRRDTSTLNEVNFTLFTFFHPPPPSVLSIQSERQGECHPDPRVCVKKCAQALPPLASRPPALPRFPHCWRSADLEAPFLARGGLVDSGGDAEEC